VNIKTKISHTSQQKIGSAYAQSSQKCSNIEILVKIERKENCYRIFDQGHVRLDLGRKKFKTISCLCTLKLMQFDDTLMISYRCKEIHSWGRLCALTLLSKNSERSVKTVCTHLHRAPTIFMAFSVFVWRMWQISGKCVHIHHLYIRTFRTYMWKSGLALKVRQMLLYSIGKQFTEYTVHCSLHTVCNACHRYSTASLDF